MYHQTSDFSQFFNFGVLSVKEAIEIASYCVSNDCSNCPLEGVDKCDKQLIRNLLRFAEVSLL